jgi:hypothetical protein
MIDLEGIASVSAGLTSALKADRMPRLSVTVTCVVRVPPMLPGLAGATAIGSE